LQVQVWRVDNFQKEPWPEHLKGQFFGGDSFIVHYSYVPRRIRDAGGQGSAEEHVIYVWEGRDSPAEEREAAAQLALALEDECGGRAVRARVAQGKEPDHMAVLFKGRMVRRTPAAHFWRASVWPEQS
jgi:hypothetical protein